MAKPVFLIDDDEDVRDVVKFALEQENYQVVDFENAARGLEFLRGMKPADYPCLVIVDYLMPKMDGWKFIHAMKDHRDLKSIPMVLCSAKGSEEVPGPLPEGVSHLNKPMDLEELLNAVHRHCR
jgi:CheY-like chemotaxis protein